MSGTCADCRQKQFLGKPLQAKLRLNEPGEVYEQADHVAEQVMRMPDTKVTKSNRESGSPRVQRRATSGGTAVADAPPIVHHVLNSPGQPLDAATRTFFEPRFGHDFSRVRVHAGERAAESARSVNALAYTVGEDIVFRTGQFDPHSSTGQRVLAHELTHVVQNQSDDHQNISRKKPEDDGGDARNPRAKQLLQAAEDGDSVTVERLTRGGLFHKGIEIDVTDEYGWTPLILAADAGHQDIVRLLLERGADSEALTTTAEGRSPLTTAVRSGQTEVVRVLLEGGSNMYALDRSGSSAPVWAALEGQIPAMTIFLNNGLNVNYQDDDGISLITYGALACQLPMVQMLFGQGANLLVRDKHGYSALEWAEMRQQEAEVKLGTIISEYIPADEQYSIERRDKESRAAEATERVASCQAVAAYLRSVSPQ
jgi:ankyrin repeat protein